MENQNDTYKAEVYCGNCDLREEINILKGQTINETKCPNCGTCELDKDHKAVTLRPYIENYR
ncbi:MAG: hypothetical protein K8Q91_01230 [Candidatus Vogelbacteria bacterium]|nr:hypothetical protein [Candidatus Vogelbacteria bacterium]